MNQIKWQGKSKAQMHRFIKSNEAEGYSVYEKFKHQNTRYVVMVKAAEKEESSNEK
ncbi:hypothetical protein [Carnobacterium maltaromaticum]|uniref:hypothetical protein n=1 Tax=Carnobacterium maltaromaticum TaxID=2751 RepID=UPI0039BDF4FE